MFVEHISEELTYVYLLYSYIPCLFRGTVTSYCTLVLLLMAKCWSVMVVPFIMIA